MPVAEHLKTGVRKTLELNTGQELVKKGLAGDGKMGGGNQRLLPKNNYPGGPCFWAGPPG
ncbi:hypothetical protein GCM10023187_23410 [Nibrella viscosa]|uniref:Uncharacterized protein n=1 Tax=Nibrella viscosa TaxID=1084524 RepID=A0ABP8KEW0_9BACT